MPYFDRFDICDAYAAFHTGYHAGGYATGRRERHNGSTNSDIHARLHRIGYRRAGLPLCDVEALSENGRAIYDALVARKGY